MWRLGPRWRSLCELLVLTRSGQLDKLVTSQLGLLAQRRLARGVKLNHAEATVRVHDAPGTNCD